MTAPDLLGVSAVTSGAQRRADPRPVRPAHAIAAGEPVARPDYVDDSVSTVEAMLWRPEHRAGMVAQ